MISFEFFPPKTEEAAAQLQETAKKLGECNPSFFSVTYGAGGTTQQGTVETVLSLRDITGISTVPHLTCINATKEKIRKLIVFYKEKKFSRLVVLRGDLPEKTVEHRDFQYANSLVEFIRAETGDYFTLEVAAYPEFHPQAPTAAADLRNFKTKISAGANSAITQYFLNADAYFRFRESCEKLGITVPIIPGILPITDYLQLIRFSNFCGAEIPRWINKRLENLAKKPAALLAFGCEVITELCTKLLAQGAPGLHFYTLNKAEPTLAICQNLNLH